MDKQQKCLVPGEASESEEDDVVISVVGSGRYNNNFSDLRGTVVPGEAPESDDEEFMMAESIRSNVNSSDDKKEDDSTLDEDDDDEDSCSSASEAFKDRAAAAVSGTNNSSGSTTSTYNSLLHRKLCDNNLSLQKGISDLINVPLANTSHKLNVINQQLLTSQVEIQDAVTTIKRSFNTYVKIENTLGAVLAMPFLPKININVPTKNFTS